MKAKNKKVTARDMELMFEISCLRFIPRTGSHFLGSNFQNLMEHHFRVTWIALLLAKAENISNTEKIIKMALIHDLAESRTGDVNYLQRQYVKRHEKMAIQDMFSGTLLQEEFLPLWEEYEKKESVEAKIVKDADNLDVDLSLKEEEANGKSLPKVWFEHREQIAKTKLYTASARKLFNQIWEANPHDWHLKGRNRLNGGDWKDR